MNQTKIGEFLQQLRKDKNLTQQEVAEIFFVSRECVSKWERGISIPDPQQLINVSKFYNVTINEILYGEYENESNRENINETPARILKVSKEERNKLIYRFIILILILSLTFFITYFVNNYNSIKVYMISGDGTNFDLSQGMLITSPNKSYLQLGKIVNFTEEEIESVEIFYKKNDSTIQITYNDDPTQVAVSLNKNNELMKEKSIKEILENLYVTIKTKNKTETVKLNYRINFENDDIIEEINPELEEIDYEYLSSEEFLNKFELVDDKLVYDDGEYQYEYDKYTQIIFVKKDGVGIKEYYINKNINKEYRKK